jgi:hypothetical protein
LNNIASVPSVPFKDFQEISGISAEQIRTHKQKKMTAPGLHTGSGQAKQNPFEVNVSIPIGHYITSGLALPYPFS